MRSIFQAVPLKSEFEQIKSSVLALENNYQFYASGCYGFSDSVNPDINALINTFCNNIKESRDMMGLSNILFNYINQSDSSDFFRKAIVEKAIMILSGQAKSSFEENLAELNQYLEQSQLQGFPI